VQIGCEAVRRANPAHHALRDGAWGCGAAADQPHRGAPGRRIRPNSTITKTGPSTTIGSVPMSVTASATGAVAAPTGCNQPCIGRSTRARTNPCPTRTVNSHRAGEPKQDEPRDHEAVKPGLHLRRLRPSRVGRSPQEADRCPHCRPGEAAGPVAAGGAVTAVAAR
jgi:hypothetical protein